MQPRKRNEAVSRFDGRGVPHLHGPGRRAPTNGGSLPRGKDKRLLKLFRAPRATRGGPLPTVYPNGAWRNGGRERALPQRADISSSVRIVRLMQDSSPVNGRERFPGTLVRGAPPNSRERPCAAPTRPPRPCAPPLCPPCPPSRGPRRRCAGRAPPTPPARTLSGATS